MNITSDCTPLERRLSFLFCFLYTFVLNPMFRLFVWLYFGSPQHHGFIIVIGTRSAIGVTLLKLHKYFTGDKVVDSSVSTIVSILPGIIVDLAIGSCYHSGARWLANAYCSQKCAFRL